MANYDIFSKFYDELMGDRTDTIFFIENLISDANPKAKSVLEIACGTGSVLTNLNGKYEISGLDISSGMISEAKKRIKEGNFYIQDMVSFNLNKKFDIIYCIYDSINHLPTFSDWKKVFKNVLSHLNENGVFIFDMNTRNKLKKFADYPMQIHKFGNNYCIMGVQKGEKGKYDWPIKIFESLGENMFKLHEENITEMSFPIKKVAGALSSFSEIKMIDIKGLHVSEKSDRVNFICKK